MKNILKIIFFIIIGVISFLVIGFGIYYLKRVNQSNINMSLLFPRAQDLVVEGIKFRDLNKNGRLDVYEEYPTLYKKIYFKYDNKKIMTYIMQKKSKLTPPTTRYLNIIKQGYKDCKLNMKSLNDALLSLKHLRR